MSNTKSVMSEDKNIKGLNRIVIDRYEKYVNYVAKTKGISPMDGLKVSQRLVLWGAYKVAKNRVKSARLVGTVMSDYWPHGDMSIYQTIAGLVEKGLLTGYGEWGDFNLSTEPAAMRYTEVKISDLALELLFDKDELECVEYEDSFDARTKIPVYLPAKIPLALAIGQSTIGIEEFSNVEIPRFTLESVKKTYNDFYNHPKTAKLSLEYYNKEGCIIKDGTFYPSIVDEGKDKVALVANTGKYDYNKIMKLLKEEGFDAVNLSGQTTHIVINKRKDKDVVKFLTERLANKNIFKLSGFGFNKNLDNQYFNDNISIEEYITIFVKFRKHFNEKVRLYKINKLQTQLKFFEEVYKYRNLDVVTLSGKVAGVSDMTVGGLVKILDSEYNRNVTNELKKEIKKLEGSNER